MKTFERLDQNYLEDLAARAMRQDSDAFAELFAATADRQLYYLTQLFGDRAAALDRLGQVYADVMRQFSSLGDPGSFTAWVSRMSANAYMAATGKINASHGPYSLTQLLNLPLTEAQIMLMRSEQQLSEAEIAAILSMSRSSVRRFIKSAARRLGGGGRMGGSRRRVKAAPLTTGETSEILDSVFESCGRPHNTTPVEDLSSYAVYRKERFNVQRGIIAAWLFIFALLPLCFVMPSIEVGETGRGTRGLPEYDVSVRSLLPVGRVVATINDIELPVYEASGREYTIEPTGNGTMTVSVELINKQKAEMQVEVTDVDSEPPRLVDTVISDDTITIMTADDGIGVDWRGVYAETASGERVMPLSADEKNGIVFDFPTEEWVVSIPDHLGNTLRLNLKLN